MRVLFFGTSPFALPTLQSLHDSAPHHQILAVVTQPDRPSGRGMKLHYSPVKELALGFGYEVLQPERVRRRAFLDQATALAPDVLVVVSFGQIISQAMLDLPRFGGINVHASLLPRWRGAAPIHHAILAGDPESGVATMQMEASLDTGPVYRFAKMNIEPEDTVGSLEPRLAILGGRLLIETLDALESGAAVAAPQSEDGMTYARPVTREDGLLDPVAQTAAEMDRCIRGTDPRPGAFLSLSGKPVRVLSALVLDPQAAAGASHLLPPGLSPGTIRLMKTGIAIAAAEDTVLEIKRLQPENKGPMDSAEWARGARLPADAMATRVDR